MLGMSAKRVLSMASAVLVLPVAGCETFKPKQGTPLSAAEVDIFRNMSVSHLVINEVGGAYKSERRFNSDLDPVSETKTIK